MASSTSGTTLGVWLTTAERERLDDAAAGSGIAANAIVRYALRKLLGLPLDGDWIERTLPPPPER